MLDKEISLNEKLKYFYPHYRKPFRFFAYLFNYKQLYKKLSTKRDEIEKDIQRYKDSKNKLAQDRQEYEDVINYFKQHFAPKFLEWTNKIVICTGGANDIVIIK